MENNIYHLISVCDELNKKVGSLWAVCIVLAFLVGVSTVISIMSLILVVAKLDFTKLAATCMPAPDFSHGTEQSWGDRVHLGIPPELKTKTVYDKDTNSIRHDFATDLQEATSNAASPKPVSDINSTLAYKTDLSNINISMETIENDPFTRTEFLTKMVLNYRDDQIRPLAVLVSGKCLLSYTTHIVEILKQLSITDASIVVYNDCGDDESTLRYIERICALDIRVDKLLGWEDNITISDLASFDIVFTPNAGMRSAYELCHSVIRELVK